MANYYEILEVDEKASQKTIWEKYKQLSEKYNPNLYSDPLEKQANQKLLDQVQEAFNTLSDVLSKREYDEQMVEARPLPPVILHYSYREVIRAHRIRVLIISLIVGFFICLVIVIKHPTKEPAIGYQVLAFICGFVVIGIMGMGLWSSLARFTFGTKFGEIIAPLPSIESLDSDNGIKIPKPTARMIFIAVIVFVISIIVIDSLVKNANSQQLRNNLCDSAQITVDTSQSIVWVNNINQSAGEDISVIISVNNTLHLIDRIGAGRPYETHGIPIHSVTLVKVELLTNVAMNSARIPMTCNKIVYQQ